MSTENSERPTHGTTTEREPGTGRIVTISPNGRRVYEPEDAPLTQWPSGNPPAKQGK